MARKISNILLKLKAVSLQPNDPFTWASGIKSPIYCDNRVLMSYPEDREVVIKEFLKVLKSLEFDVLAGTATSGIPWCAWLARELDKPMVYVRGASKVHGKQNQVEGVFKKGDKIVVVEDLISTGGSSIRVVQALKEAGAVVEDCVAIFTYELAKSVSKFGDENCNIHTLTNFSELVDEAAETDYIKSEDKEVLMKWKKDPEKWP